MAGASASCANTRSIRANRWMRASWSARTTTCWPRSPRTSGARRRATRPAPMPSACCSSTSDRPRRWRACSRASAIRTFPSGRGRAGMPPPPRRGCARRRKPAGRLPRACSPPGDAAARTTLAWSSPTRWRATSTSNRTGRTRSNAGSRAAATASARATCLSATRSSTCRSRSCARKRRRGARRRRPSHSPPPSTNGLQPMSRCDRHGCTTGRPCWPRHADMSGMNSRGASRPPCARATTTSSGACTPPLPIPRAGGNWRPPCTHAIRWCWWTSSRIPTRASSRSFAACRKPVPAAR